MANSVTSPDPIQGDTVVIDDPAGEFNGAMGRVIGLEPDRRPLPWIRVQFDVPFPGVLDTLFTATELVVLGRRS
jgi:hypothetical protein